MDEKDLSILYRPRVEIERDYRSNAVIQHELPDNQTEEEKIQQSSVQKIPDDITKAIQNAREAGRKLLRIRKITDVLPPGMKPTVDVLIDTVLIWIGITIEHLGKIPTDETHWVSKGPYGPTTTYPPGGGTTKDPTKTKGPDEGTTDTGSEDNDWPVMTSSGFVFDVIKNKDSWDMAYDQYLLDSAAIQEDFADEYNNIMEGYVYQLVSAMDEVGLDTLEYLNYEYEGETVTGIPTNYMHLNDIIVKNQDIIHEYSDIFRKTHDLYTTDAILTAWDVASQKRVRYLKENYKPETAGTYIEMYDKNYLADSRNEMEQNYIKARTNVYKLLHSVCQISKEMLDTQLKLAVSKCSLLAKEVNIFAKKEYENTSSDSSTSNINNKQEEMSEDKTGTVTDTVKQDGILDSEIEDFTVAGGFGSAFGQGLKNTVASAQQKTKDAIAGVKDTANIKETKGQGT